MAKIYKISGYVVDVHDECEDWYVKWLIERYSDLTVKHFKVESVDIGEWYDEHPLNYNNSDISE